MTGHYAVDFSCDPPQLDVIWITGDNTQTIFDVSGDSFAIEPNALNAMRPKSFLQEQYYRKVK